MRDTKVVLDPGDEVVLESSLDDLMKNVWGDQFMDIRSREVICEWLDNYVSRFPTGISKRRCMKSHNDITNQTIFIPQCP
jgi:hypothetical protein